MDQDFIDHQQELADLREIERLKRLTSRLEAKLSKSEARIADLEAKLAAAEATREEAEKLAVWAVRHHAGYYADKPIGHVNYWIEWDDRTQDEQECDGTDAGILAALKKAMNAC